MNLSQGNLAGRVLASSQVCVPDWKRVYVSVLTAIAASVAYLDLANYYSVLTDGALLPKYVYYAMAVAIAPLIVAHSRMLRSYLATPFIFWTVAMVLLNFMHWLFQSVGGDSDAAGMTLTRIQYLVLSALIGCLFIQARPVLLGWVFVGLALILTALQLIDFFFPGTIVPFGTEGVVLGRAGSTLINANKAAESLVLLAVLGVAVLRPAWRIWLLMLVLPGVLLTFSRSGMVAWSVVLIAGFGFRLFPRSAYVLVLLFIPLAVSTAAGVLGLILSYVDIDALDNVYDRVMFFLTLETSDNSTQERLSVAHFAVESFLSQPVFGNGAGYTHFWGATGQAPHNQHLLMLAEYGAVGYALFLWLILLLFRGGGYFRSLQSQRSTMVAFAAFLVFALFTHNMLDNLNWLVSFAFIGQRTMHVRE